MQRVINSDVVYWNRPTNNVMLEGILQASSGETKYINDFMMYDAGNILDKNEPFREREYCWRPDVTDTDKTLTVQFYENKRIRKIVVYEDFDVRNHIKKLKIQLGEKVLYCEPNRNGTKTEIVLDKSTEGFPQLDFKLDYVRDDTALAAWCKKKGVEDHLTTSAFVELPTTVEEYNAKLSKSTKQNLRTALNRMKKDGYVYELFVHKNIDDDEFINELSTIHAERARIKNRVHDQELIHCFSRILHANYEELKNKTYDIIKNSMRRMKNSVLVVVKLNNETVGYLYGLRDDKAIRIMQNCFNDSICVLFSAVSWCI